MANDTLDFTTPTGRLVGGSPSKPRDITDNQGKPVLHDKGPDIGKVKQEYSFAVAIPKTPGCSHWAQEAWGKGIWELAHTSWPAGEAQRPDFSWKITDGDSTIPNKAGRKPADQQGYPGNWVIWFSGMLPPRLYTLIGVNEATLLVNPEEMKPGYYVQVRGSTRSNGPSQSPGMYMNHSMVCLIAYGQEIVFGPDVKDAGFGGGPLPAGASTTPVGNFSPPPVPGNVPAPGAATPIPAVPVPGAATTVVVPNAAVLQPPPPARQLTEKAQGATYEQLIAAGWDDAKLIQNGLMLA
jgi:hypothetical protein